MSPIAATSASGVAFVGHLARHGDRCALVDAATGETLTYRELDARIAAAAAQLPAERSLVQISLDRTVDGVVLYLAALAGNHVVLLSPTAPDRAAALVETFDPAVVVERRDGTLHVTWRGGHRPLLHPDLAVLMSTSGSTGSPKLVRLSTTNVQSNAEQITEALGITPDDRAVTSLPLSYSYGLSVLHSHLLVGASVLLTEHSVVEAPFWDAMARHSVTTLPGVPYTFEMLERVGFSRMRLPALRHLTAAGGRVAPQQLRRFAELGADKGFVLHAMYGQTEATARIATLDPALVGTRPDSIGRPVPGGSITLDRQDEDGVGEIVFQGPNVMLGYATSPADLCLGRTIDVLRTGDLARHNPDGTYSIVGRTSRMAKVFGLRIDLDRVERALADAGVSSCISESDRGLCVVADGRVDASHLADLTARAAGLPLHVVQAHVVTALPRLPNGKIDRVSACASCDDTPDPVSDGPDRGAEVTAEDIRALYALLLGRPDAGLHDSFVQLGGDSLSFVEVSVRLEALLGELPVDWHTRSPVSLAGTRTTSRGITAQVETGLVLRATAIVAIVGSHIGAFHLIGGAHTLLGLAGFAMARFLLGGAGSRSRRLLRGTARIAVPSALWIAAVALVTGDYGWANVALINTFVGPQEFGPGWHFWFVEALVLFLLTTAVAFSIPGVDRLERRAPFVFAGLVVLAGLTIRYGALPGFDDPRPLPASGLYFFWFFAIGWWAARASTRLQQLLVTAVVLVTVPGYWQDPGRELAVIAGLLLLVWVPTLRVPRFLVPVLSLVAAASLAIYLSHWVVFPSLQATPWLALAASVTVGVLVYEVARVAMKVAKSRSFWSAYDSAYSVNARSARSPVPR